MTQGPDGCIMAFAPSDWGWYMDEMLEIDDMEDEEHLDMMREVLSPATNVSVDSQWRLKIPEKLAEYAKLDRDVEIVGHIDRIEIWSSEVRQEYMSVKKSDNSKVIKRVFRPKPKRSRIPEVNTDTE